MGKFTGNQSEVPSNKVPAYPSHCPCGNRTVRAEIRVYDDAGRIYRGAFGDYSVRTQDGLRLRPPYTFAGWTAYCEQCDYVYAQRENDLQARIVAGNFNKRGGETDGGYLQRCKEVIHAAQTKITSRIKRGARR